MAVKKGTKKTAEKAQVDSDLDVDAAEAPLVGEAPAADEPTPARRPLVRNINIDGVWYGPAWGNADQYPGNWYGLRDTLFED